MSGFEVRAGGTRFRITVDDFSGGSAGGTGGSSANQPNALALKLPPNVMLDLNNALVDVDGVVRRRGPIKASAAGANDITSATSQTVLGTLRYPSSPNSTAGPYLCIDLTGTTITPKFQNASGASITPPASVRQSGTKGPYPVSKTTSIGKFIVVAGRAGTTANPNAPMIVRLYAPHDTATAYTTGTVTMTANRATVTGSGTTWVSAMEGRMFVLSSNETTGARAYIVKTVASATSLILDTPYVGDGAGAARTYQIGGHCPLDTGITATDAWAGNGFAPAKVACEHASRLFLGWTVESETSGFAITLGTSPEYKSRVRWSGIAGSTEGPDTTVAAISGIFGWHANGYLDLNTRYGGILAMQSYRGSLVVWQEYGMTVLYGTPTFSSAGSIDATTVFPDVQISSGFAYEATDYGVFFIDKKRGPMLYTGSGRPEPLPMSRAIRETVKAYDHVGYVNQHVVFLNSALASTFEGYLYHVPTRRWTRITNSSTKAITHPQRSNDHECCALLVTSTGSRVISLDSLTIPDGTATDSDGSTYTFTVQTGHFGDPTMLLRADKIHIVYRASGTPSTTLAVRSGLPNNQDSAHTSTTTIASAATGTSGADLETLMTSITMDRDPTISIKINDAAATTGHLEIASVVIEGSIEGDGSSS